MHKRPKKHGTAPGARLSWWLAIGLGLAVGVGVGGEEPPEPKRGTVKVPSVRTGAAPMSAAAAPGPGVHDPAAQNAGVKPADVANDPESFTVTWETGEASKTSSVGQVPGMLYAATEDIREGAATVRKAKIKFTAANLKAPATDYKVICSPPVMYNLLGIPVPDFSYCLGTCHPMADGHWTPFNLNTTYNIPPGRHNFQLTHKGTALTGRAVPTTVFSVTVAGMAFNYDRSAHAGDGLNIRQSRDGAKIQAPEWPAGGAALYTGGGKKKAKVRLTVAPSGLAIPLKLDATVKRRVKNAAPAGGAATFTLEAMSWGGMAPGHVTFRNGVSEGEEIANVDGFVEFEGSNAAPAAVLREDTVWEWRVCGTDGEDHTPVTVQTIGHKDSGGGPLLYTVIAEPKAPWVQTDTNPADLCQPWVSALEFAIDPAQGNMHRSDTAVKAGSAIVTYLAEGFGLKYETKYGDPSYWLNDKNDLTDLTGFDLSGYMAKNKGNIVCCYDQAFAVGHFMCLVGLDAKVAYVRPFGRINEVDLVGVGRCNNPIYDSKVYENPRTPDSLKRPLIPQSDRYYPFRSGFRDHMFIECEGKVFDATSGFAKGSDSRSSYLNKTIDPVNRASVGGTTNRHQPYGNTIN